MYRDLPDVDVTLANVICLAYVVIILVCDRILGVTATSKRKFHKQLWYNVY